MSTPLIIKDPLLLWQSRKDDRYLNKDVHPPKQVGHSQWHEYLYQIGNIKGLRILEVGSRKVVEKSEIRERLSNAEYVGFDYYAGENVDVVGDAHKLSSYFKEGEQFDIIFSSACFEHFAMPWIVATEITKLLKVGGILFIETHFSYAAHERPWNFFQFSEMALKVLFSPALGYECLDAGMSNPIVGRFSSLADDYLKFVPVRGLYCHSEYLGKKVKEVTNFDWASIDLKDLVANTHYPEPK